MQGVRKGVCGGFFVPAAGKVAKALLAAALACALVPAVAAEKAFAAEVEYVGTIVTQPLIDDDGYPVFNEDGTIARGEPQITLTEIRNAPETLVIPDTMDVIEERGEETVVHKDVPVTVLSLQSWGRASGFPGIKTVDASKAFSLTSLGCIGMASLETITCEGSSVKGVHLSENPSLSSVNLENCPDFADFSLSGSPQLSLDCIAPVAPYLETLDLYSRDDIVDFDASEMPELRWLTIGNSSLASIDVSKNDKLERLQLSGNQLTSLDADAIPADLELFSCTRNHLQDTDALVAKFGKDAVLPQSDNPVSGLTVVNEYEASGTLAVGTSLRKGLSDTYHPSQQEMNSFYQEQDRDSIWAKDNFTVSSSDPLVVTVEKDAENQAVVITGIAAGTATLTFEYQFEGEYATYEGRQVIEFTVALGENPVTGISCEPAVEVPLTQCAITGSPHLSSSQNSVIVPVEVVVADPSRVPTGSFYLQVQTNDSSVVTASYVEADAAEGKYRIQLFPLKAGSTDVTVTGITSVDGEEPQYTDPVTMKVDVAERTPKPTLRISDSVTKWYYPEAASVATESVITPYSSSIASYEDSEDLQVESAAHFGGGGFAGGNSKVEGTDTPVFTATSDNPDVVAVQQDDMGYVKLQYKALGTARITIEDVWGNEGTCEVAVKDLASEVKKYRLSKTEITITKGETLDLSDYIDVQSEQPVARMARAANASALKQEELVGKPVFKSSNGNILPVKYNDDNAVSQVLGRNVGDVTVSANILKPGSPEGAPLETIDRWEVFNFSTLVVHVVEPDVPADNPATGVQIIGDANEVEIGSTLQLSATITPIDATDADTLAWTTSDQAVATVDDTGTVSPVACGTAVITATVGSVSDTYEIAVVPQTVPATSVTLSSVQTAMKVGETQQISATLAPVGTTDKVTWSSSDDTVLAVDQSGRIKAVGNGTASIKAAAGSVSATTDPIVVTTPVAGVALDASTLEMYVGAAPSKLHATVTPDAASNKEVAWTSSDRAVATVDSQGAVTPVSAGAATITATTADGDFSATCAVTVKQHAEGISLDKSNLVLTGASSSELVATIAPQDATNKEVQWASSDEGVVTVDASGKVTAVGKGAATVTASTVDGSFSASCSVTVSNPITGIELAPTTLSLVKGETAKVSLSCTAALPGDMDEAGAPVWKTSEQSVVALTPDGLDCTIEARSSGVATVEASLDDGALSAACAVAVTNPLQSIALSESTKTVTVGDSSFTLTVLADPADADDVSVAWSTSDASVATVAPTGEVRIVGSGTANIVATVGEKTATCVLSVKAKELASASSDSGFVASVVADDANTVKALEEKIGSKFNLVVNSAAVTAPVQKAFDGFQAAGLTIAETFDIHFSKDNGDEIVINDDDVSLTVKIKMTDAMKALDPATLLVSYIADDGTVEKKETWVDGDFLCFKTSHFSTYAVTGRPSVVSGSDGGDGGNGESTAVTPLGKKKEGLAPTGDRSASVAGTIVLACVVAGLSVAFARRKVR